MSSTSFRVGDCLPAGFPVDDETAQVLVLAVLASIYPKGMMVVDLARQLSDEDEDWVDRAVRDLTVANLVRREGGRAFATFPYGEIMH
ncbi:MAG TPA: hypothetical protein VFY69_05775 [Solirubrobacterales bacterium]|nr:hypothetical protein [Solirubrobacterales bacterium]